MFSAGTKTARSNVQMPVKNNLLKTAKKQMSLLLMSIPILVYLFIFSYRPLKGLIMAFQNYRPGKKDQVWVGLKHFKSLFTDEGFLRVLRNTICMSVINLSFGFIFAILLAILLNEIKSSGYKRVVQSVSYLPHFLSWIIVTGLVQNFLSTDGGVINGILMQLHLIKTPIHFLGDPGKFWWIVGGSHVWKETGWNSIIYLAAITAISPELYEAAYIDGANRFQKIRYITLPGIKPTIIVLLILNLGWILNAGFEVQFLLGNGIVQDVSETIDIFVLRNGISQGNYSLATAAGLFRSFVSLFMLTTANLLAKRFGEERLV
jgi:putative aldouronate transport system permease protein